MWTASHLGGFVAAWTFLMTRWTLWEFVPSAPQYAVLQYLPMIVLVASKPATSFKQALLLLPLVVLQSLASLLYLGVAVFAPLTLLALFRLARSATRRSGLRLLGVLLLALLVLLPLVAEYGAVCSRGLRLRRGHGGSRTESVPISSRWSVLPRWPRSSSWARMPNTPAPSRASIASACPAPIRWRWPSAPIHRWSARFRSRAGRCSSFRSGCRHRLAVCPDPTRRPSTGRSSTGARSSMGTAAIGRRGSSNAWSSRRVCQIPRRCAPSIARPA